MEYVTLNNGVRMPMLGFGVFQTPVDDTERCVREAIETGYRLIDTAQSYHNEEGVGAAVRGSGVDRSELFVTSKIWVDNMNYERAKRSIDETLKRMGLEYLDLMLLHQAFGDYPGAYRALEEAYDAGKLRAIGVSNFYPERLTDMCMLARITPAVNQIETHPFHQQAAAHATMKKLGVVHEAWSPFAEAKNGIFSNPVLAAIANKHGKTIGQVILRAMLDMGIVVIPKTVRRERMAENIDVFDFHLDAEDVAAFKSLEDPAFPRICDHLDPAVVAEIIKDHVKPTLGEPGYLY